MAFLKLKFKKKIAADLSLEITRSNYTGMTLNIQIIQLMVCPVILKF
jgi:hypothetical protein